MSYPPIPKFDNPLLEKYLRDLTVAVREQIETRVHRLTAENSLLFITPNGSVYEVSVSDAGAWVITQVSS